MKAHAPRRTLAGLCLAALLCSGCQSGTGGMFWWQKDSTPGIETPSERISRLQREAKEVGSLSAADQERRVAEWAAALTREPDAVLRVALVRALGEVKGPNADAALKTALADGDKDVRIAACEVWARRGGEAAQLLGGLIASDTSNDVQLAAVRALGQVGDRQSLALFTPALESRDPALQFRAMRSMETISGEAYGDDVDAWRELAKGGHPTLREQSVAERLRRLF